MIATKNRKKSRRKKPVNLDGFFQVSAKDFNPVVLEIPLLVLLYYLSLPIAWLCLKLKLTPHFVTTLSNLLALASAAVLWLKDWPFVFALLWLLALLFDIADGNVARHTHSTSANGSFYDHASDKLKILVLFLAVALKYDQPSIWILSFLTSGLFLFFGCLNELLAHRRFRYETGVSKTKKGTSSSALKRPQSRKKGALQLLKNQIKKFPSLRKLLEGTYRSLFIMQGNSMLFLIPLAFAPPWVYVSFAWFGFLVLKGTKNAIVSLIEVNRNLAESAVSWK